MPYKKLGDSEGVLVDIEEFLNRNYCVGLISTGDGEIVAIIRDAKFDFKSNGFFLYTPPTFSSVSKSIVEKSFCRNAKLLTKADNCLSQEELDFIFSCNPTFVFLNSDIYENIRINFISKVGVQAFFQESDDGIVLTDPRNRVMFDEFIKYFNSSNIDISEFPLLKSLIIEPTFII